MDAYTFIKNLADYVSEYDSFRYHLRTADVESKTKETADMLEKGNIAGIRKYLYSAIDDAVSLAQKEEGEELLRQLKMFQNS